MKPRVKTFVEITAAYAALFAASIGGSAVASLTGSPFFMLLIPSLAMLAAVAFTAFAFGHRTKEDFNIFAPSPRHLIPSGVMGVGGYFLMAASTLVIGVLLPSLTNETDALLGDQYLSKMSPFAVIVAVVVVPAVCEELIFRGFFFKRLSSAVKPFPAMLISGVMFAAAHLDLYKLLPITIMGIVFAYIAYKTGSFVITAILHMINNAISVVALYRGADTVEVGGAYSIVVTDRMAVFYALAYTALGGLLVYVALKIFKTITLKGWKSKLIIILSIVAFFGCNVGALFSEMSIPLSVAETLRLPEQTVYEAEFTLEDARLVQVSYGVIGGGGAKSVVTITRSDGTEVIRSEGDNLSDSALMTLEAGRYIFRCETTPDPERPGGEANYIVTCNVIRFYKIELPESSDLPA